MPLPCFALLADRGLIRIGGPEARPFLNALLSNDVTRVGPDRAVYAALLTPQGKYLHDMIVFGLDGALWLDTERARQADLQRRLTLYKLRAKVEIADGNPGRAVVALWGEGVAAKLGFSRPPSRSSVPPSPSPLPPHAGGEGKKIAPSPPRSGGEARTEFSSPPLAGERVAAKRPGEGENLSSLEPGRAGPFLGGIVAIDPRLTALGTRAILPAEDLAARLTAAGFAQADAADYDRHRLALGVPDGSRDLEIEKSLLLENNFEPLHGVDFDKGCYVGQELTARTKYRALIKKRLFKVTIDGPLPPPDTPVTLDGEDAGVLRSGRDGTALALLRLEQVAEAATKGRPLLAGAARLTPVKPDWADF